ncbi:MAG: 50S ribosomal protein L9 [Armatimonadota bacterium]
MEVILKKDVQKVGKKGDVVKVSDGYARNFLLPKDLAVPANKSNMRDLSSKNKQLSEKEDRAYRQAELDAEKIKSRNLVIKSKSGGAEKLFGSVTNQDIANQIAGTFGIIVDKRYIHINQPIKTLGVHEVKIKFHPRITTDIKVEVQPE